MPPPPHQNDYVAYLTPSRNSVSFYYATKDGSYATIDWGDGNIEQTTSTSVSHTYSSSSDRGTIAIYGNLTYLNLQGTNYINEIDVSMCDNLTELNLLYNAISALDVSKNTKLTRLIAGPCSGTSIDLSNNIGLTQLYFENVDITTINLTPLTELTSITFYDSEQLTSLDCTKNKKVTYLNLTGCTSLEKLDLSGLTEVNTCIIYGLFPTRIYSKLTSIRCVNASTKIYNELIKLSSKGCLTASTGTLVTDNSTETETLRTTFESNGWTVITE